MIKSLYTPFQKWSEKGSVYIVSDTHFEDEDCIKMCKNWITPQEHIERIKKVAHKNDTLIHLGDVGNPEYLKHLKCYKVLITGNHDQMGKVREYFDEVYEGPLFIAEKILLSHEPIVGMEKFCINIHGHQHAGKTLPNHVNLAANQYGFEVFNLGEFIKGGGVAKVENYHRATIDTATERKKKRGKK